MIIMEIKNVVLRNEIMKWEEKGPAFTNFFTVFESLIEAADIIAGIYKFPDYQLQNYIVGLQCIYIGLSFQSKDEKKSKVYLDNSTELISPVLDKIIAHVDSDGYRNEIIGLTITGTDQFSFNGISGVIDANALKLYAKKIGESIVTTGDVEKIERNFVKYKRGQYSIEEPVPSVFFHTDLKLSRVDEIRRYLVDCKYTDVDENTWRHWFGKVTWTGSTKPGKINWYSASDLLSNIICLICGNFKVSTEKAMKKIFKLQKGKKFQNPTNARNQRGKYPYKRIYEIMEHAETKL